MEEEQIEGVVLDTEAIGAEALAERKAEKSGEAKSGKQPWELQFEKDHEELSPEVKVKESKKVETKEETPEEKPVIEEQPSEEEANPVEEQTAETEEKPVQDKKDTAEDEAYIAEYAKKNKVTPQEAKDEVEKIRAVLAKYNNDPLEVAKAYKLTQSAYDKLKSQSEQAQKPAIDPKVAQILSDPKGYVEKMVQANSAKLLEDYKKDYPERSLMMTDGAILEELRDKGMANLNNQINQYQTTLTREAGTKRNDFIAGVSEEDRKYIPTIKAQLDKFPDHMLVDKGFDFNHLVSWARGQHHKEDLAAEYKRGFEQGQQQKKILGEVGREAPTARVKQSKSASQASSLSNYEQGRARQMFGNVLDNDKEIFEAYLEVTKGSKK